MPPGLSENGIDRPKEVLLQLEERHQLAESFKEVRVAASVLTKVRKKEVTDAETRQMALCG